MADETIYISEIIKHLKDKGYSNAAISGILGNIDVETGGTFDFQQEEIGKGKGYGLFQFDFMKSYYDDWLNKNKKNDSIQSQVDFMDDVIQGKKFIDTKDGKIEMLKPSDRVELQTFLKESNDPEEITLEFGKIFENPKQGKEHYDRRVDSALSFFTTFDQELAPPTDSQKGEITSVLESLNPRKPGGGRVSMYKGGDPDQPGANFNQLLELAIRLENARTFAGTKVADASTEMEQSPDSFLRPGETLKDWDTTFRKPNAAGGRIYGKYAQQLASGGRAGMLRDGLFGGGPPGVHGRKTGGGYSDKERHERRQNVGRPPGGGDPKMKYTAPPKDIRPGGGDPEMTYTAPPKDIHRPGKDDVLNKVPSYIFNELEKKKEIEKEKKKLWWGINEATWKKPSVYEGTTKDKLKEAVLERFFPAKGITAALHAGDLTAYYNKPYVDVMNMFEKSGTPKYGLQYETDNVSAGFGVMPDGDKAFMYNNPNFLGGGLGVSALTGEGSKPQFNIFYKKPLNAEKYKKRLRSLRAGGGLASIMNKFG